MIKETFLLAWRTVKSNKLRSGITISIIALGIMALIGIITAIQSMEQSLKENFSMMGANSFSIRFKELNVNFGNNQPNLEKSKKGQKIKKASLDKVFNKEIATEFKSLYHFPYTKTSIWRRGPRNQEIHYDNQKTNPQVVVWGGDENYISVNGYEIEYGRNLNEVDIKNASYVCLIGNNVAQKLFKDNTHAAINKIIKVGSIQYKVVGLLKSKGSSAMMRQDDIIITTHTNIRYLSELSTQFNTGIGSTYIIGITVNSVQYLDPAIQEATAIFRRIRKLVPTEENNFVVEKSDKFAEIFIGFLSSITASAAAIGLITLIGAAIGLMNIMLVAVNERNREIGLIKAIGGKRSFIRNQFLFESLIISVLGAFFGIISGIVVGNIFGLVLNTGFVIPWNWVFIGVIICTFVGLFAGLYPAIKASKLNPIQVLRAE